MPRRPHEHRQIPISSIGGWDGVRVIDCILDEMENGFFYNPALLVDQVLRDDRIRGTLMTRVLSLLGKPIEFQPAKDNARHQKVADGIEESWSDLFPDSALVELVTWGLMLGVGVAQVVWKRDGRSWFPCLEVWHPWALQWDEHRQTYTIDTYDKQRIDLTPGPYGYTDDSGGQWVLFTPFGASRPGRRGLLRNLARLYLERQWARRDRARYSEVHGQPLRVGIAPVGATRTEVSDFETSLSLLGAEPVVVGRQGEEGNVWDVKLVEASGKSHDGFKMAIEELDGAIAVAVLGQSQSTDGQAGLGSNDQAGEPVRRDIMRADGNALCLALREQVLWNYCDFTYGSGDMAPYPCFQVEPPEDTAAKATELSTLVTALAAAKAAGLPLDERAILEAFNVPMLAEAEAAKVAEEASAKAAAESQSQKAEAEPANEAAPIN